MSKSLERVREVLRNAGLGVEIIDVGAETRTARQAATATGSVVEQIAKSIVFRGEATGEIVLFITAGGNRVDPAKASRRAGQPLGKADADVVRRVTGFAIGGVAPVGHLQAVPAFFDPRLTEFAAIWAAAGTPRHLFRIRPGDLLALSGARLAQFTGTCG